jgi:hypothetical protein
VEVVRQSSNNGAERPDRSSVTWALNGARPATNRKGPPRDHREDAGAP